MELDSIVRGRHREREREVGIELERQRESWRELERYILRALQ